MSTLRGGEGPLSAFLDTLRRDGGDVALASVFGEEQAILKVVLYRDGHVAVIVEVPRKELGLRLRPKVRVEVVGALARVLDLRHDAGTVAIPAGCTGLAGGHPLVRSALALVLVALGKHEDLVCAAVVAGAQGSVVNLTIAVVSHQMLEVDGSPVYRSFSPCSSRRMSFL